MTTEAGRQMLTWWLSNRTHPPSAARQRDWVEHIAAIEAEAVAAERARIRAEVERLPGWPVFSEHDGSPPTYGNLVDRPAVTALLEPKP